MNKDIVLNISIEGAKRLMSDQNNIICLDGFFFPEHIRRSKVAGNSSICSSSIHLNILKCVINKIVKHENMQPSNKKYEYHSNNLCGCVLTKETKFTFTKRCRK